MTDEFEDLALLNAAYADDEAKRLDARFAKLLNIPAELRAIPQWMFAGADKAPHTLRDGRTVHGSVSKPDDWMTFDAAVAAARVCNGHVGFVFTKGCGFTVLDVDVKNADTHPNEPGRWTPPDVLDSLWSYVQKVSSYTERSRSGWGLHVLVRGDIGLGIHSKFLEIYSQDRFMICTGDRLEQLPATIEDRDEEVKRIADEYRKRTGALKLVELPPCTIERRTDSDVMDWLRSWSNAAQFERLWAGDIAGYPSQSEADAALLNFLWKATEDREQVFRLFRQSKLGEWDIRRRCPRFKANRNDDYLNRSLAFVVSKLVADTEAAAELARSFATTPAEAAAGQVQAAPQDETFRWPPGFAGRLAFQIFRTAEVPIVEVSTVGALATLAAVCGRLYKTNTDADTALYLILIAHTGVGKDGIHKGIPKLLRLADVKGAEARFLEEVEHASGEALRDNLLVKPGFLALRTEFGKLMKRMANHNDNVAQGFEAVLTKCFNANTLGGVRKATGSIYMPKVAVPALSFCSESTPEQVYDSITSGMLEGGFLPRLLFVSYLGPEPPENDSKEDVLNPQELAGWHGLVEWALNKTPLLPQEEPYRIAVQMPPEVQAVSKGYRHHCRERKNAAMAGSVSAEAAVWNRLHLKALKVATLLAVADTAVTGRWWEPAVTMEHLNWAIWLVEREATSFLRRVRGGDVGVDDFARQSKLLSICEQYLALDSAKVPSSYRAYEKLRQDGYITYDYLAKRTSGLAAFRDHKLGSKAALDIAIKSAIQSGRLFEDTRQKLTDTYKYHGMAFKLLGALKV